MLCLGTKKMVIKQSVSFFSFFVKKIFIKYIYWGLFIETS